jgi:DNA-binding response OmpR family regulator
MAEMDCPPQAQDDTRIVMLIDDEPAQSLLITAIAARDGWRTIIAPDAETAIAMLGTREGMQLSAILLDQWVPGDDACALITELKSRRPALPILMLTTSASPLLAVEAMRAGASDYLVKPVSPDRLMEALRSVTTRESPRDELAPLTEKMSASLDFDAMIGTAPQFRTALAQAAKDAPEPVTVDAQFKPSEQASKLFSVAEGKALKGVTKVAVPLFSVEFSMSLSSSSRVLPSVYLLMQTRREDSRWFALTQFQQLSEDAYVYVYVHMYMYVYISRNMYIYI